MTTLISFFNNEYIKTTNLENLENFEHFQEICEELISIRKAIRVNVFVINEEINFRKLTKFKNLISKLNINYLQILSNNRETIITGKSLKINSTFVSEKEINEKLLSPPPSKKDDILHKGTVRSGDRISSNGDLFVFGDVNPGAVLSAKKNVYVWGKLLGIAFAGEGGDQNSSIASLYLNPLQLRIANVVAIGPKEKPKNSYPEIAVLEREIITIKPYLVGMQKTTIF